MVRMYIGDEHIEIHPVYRPNADDKTATMKWDFALIFLPAAVSRANLVRLNNNPNVPSRNGEPLQMAGWGSTKTVVGPFPSVPYAITVGYLSRQDCMRGDYEWDDIPFGMFCAEPDDGKAFCTGDDGGPLILARASGGPANIIPVQVGVASYGDTSKCCQRCLGFNSV